MEFLHTIALESGRSPYGICFSFQFPPFALMPPRISLTSAIFLVTASMLGSGILTTTGSILSLVKSPQAVMTVWLLAGLHAVVGAYCYGLIVRRMPLNGGEASILKTYFSPALGEIAGWVSFVVGFAASNAASAIGFSAYFEKALGASEFGGRWAAVAAILAVTLMHSVAGPSGMKLQTAMAFLKFALLGLLSVWAFLHAAPPAGAPTEGHWETAAFGPAWGLAIMFSMFAYLGWSAAMYSAAETKDTERTVPKAMLAGTLIVLALYALVNLAVLKHVPLAELAKEKAVIELLVRKLFGEDASRLFAGVVSFALLSSLGASAFLGPRVLHTMLGWYRRERESVENPQQPPAIPPFLVWVQALLSIAMILSGTFEQILTVTGFLLGLFPVLAVLGLYTAKANAPQPVSTMARGVAAPLFVAGSLLILFLGAMERPAEMGVATLIVLVIFLVRRKASDSVSSPS